MKKSTLYVGVALALQVVGVISGILVVRVATTVEYGLYSMAFGLVAAGTSISDAGIGSTIISQTAKRPDDMRNLRLWIDVAGRFRRKMGRAVEVLCLAVMIAIGIQQNISWQTQILTCLTIVALLESTFVRGVWVNFYRITGRAHESQTIDLVWSMGRVLAVASLLLFDGPKLFWLYLILVVSNWVIALHMRHRAQATLGPKTSDTEGAEEKVTFRRAFLHVLPLNSVNVLRGQALNILVTTLAGLAVLGQVNALARYSMAYIVVLSFLEEIIAPRLARVEQGKFFRFLGLVGLVMAGIIVIGTALTWLLADPLLMVLGPAYAGLRWELVVTMAGAGLMSAAMAWGFINQARHWVEGAWIAVPLSILWLVVCYFTLDLSSLPGAVIMVASQPLPLLLVELYRTILGLRKWRNEAQDVAASSDTKVEIA